MPEDTRYVSPIRRRVRRMGSASDSSIAEGAPVGESADLPLNDAVRARAARNTTMEDPAADFNPQARLQEVQREARATGYEREYRLGLMHRMLMRRIPLDQIAQEMGLSLRTVLRDRQELRKQLAREAKRLDLYEIIGDSVSVYEEAMGLALRAASQAKLPMNIRLAALRTALGAQNDKHRFLETAGFYTVAQFAQTDEGAASDIERLVGITERLLGIEQTVDLQTFANANEEEQEVRLL